MNKNSTVSGIIFVIIGLAIIFIGVLYLFNLENRSTNNVAQNTPLVTPVNDIKDFKVTAALPSFPNDKDLPLPTGSVVIKSYQATSPNGKVQVTKILSVPMSTPEAFSYFSDLIKAKSSPWKLISEINSSSDSKALFAQNDKGILNINISAGSKSGASVVDLSFSLN